MKEGALEPAFYARPVVEVAQALIGCVVACGECSGAIVEAEAYHDSEPASHAFAGLTPRTETLFGPPGRAYVYRSYGVHAMLNAVSEPEGVGAGVLIRALEPVRGLELMVRRRGGKNSPGARELTNGPGKLTQALGITGDDYGRDLCGERLFLEEPERGPIAAARIGRSARINVDYAGAWAAKRWRFYERGNRYVSVRPRD